MGTGEGIFDSAEWYDRGINWGARLAREVPVLVRVFGLPGSGGLMDAGCGSGRHVVGLAQRGYRVVGLDASGAMLELARGHARAAGVAADFVEAAYVDAARALDASAGGGIGGNGFDGVYCLGNALAAVGEHDVARRSLVALASVLRPGGRLVVQILNFDKLRAEQPAVRGPRVQRHGDCEYVSTRTYAFVGAQVQVTNVTLWCERGAWRQHAHGGMLCAISREALAAWFGEAGLRVDAEWGGYDQVGFDRAGSNDLIVVGTRLGGRG